MTPAGDVIRIRAFGGLTVTRGGATLDVAELGSDAADLLRFLLCHRGEPMHASVVLHELWPGSRHHAIERLRAAMHELCRLSGSEGLASMTPDLVVGVRGGLELHPDAAWSDVDEFEHAVARGREALDAGDAVSARMWLTAATALGSEELLPGAPEAPWLLAERQRVKRLAQESEAVLRPAPKASRHAMRRRRGSAPAPVRA